MNLWAVNAIHKTTGQRVGLIVDSETPPVFAYLSGTYPDMERFAIFDFNPVWLRGAWFGWHDWQHFRWDQPYWLAPFPGMSFPVVQEITLDIRALVEEGYDPLVLSEWIWGERVTAVEVTQAMKYVDMCQSVAAAMCCSHALRIAYLRTYGWQRNVERVQVIPYRVGRTRYIIGDGTHRFTADWLSDHPTIPAVCPVNSLEELKFYGIAK